MNLSPPSQVTFILSVLLAVLALLVKYAGAAIPVVNGHSFETLLVSCCFLRVSCFEASKCHGDRPGGWGSRSFQHGSVVQSAAGRCAEQAVGAEGVT